MLAGRDVARSSPSLPVDFESVSMAPVDDNKHRLECLTYHDVCEMMGYHIQRCCCYMIMQVCSICLYVFKNLFKSSFLVDGFHIAAFLLTVVVGEPGLVRAKVFGMI